MAEHLRAARRLALALLLQLGDEQVQLLDQGVDQVAAPGTVLTGHLHIVTHLTGFLMNLRALEMLILLQGLRNSSSSAVNSLSLWSRSCSFDFTLVFEASQYTKQGQNLITLEKHFGKVAKIPFCTSHPLGAGEVIGGYSMMYYALL